MTDRILEVRDLVKQYPGTTAVAGVSFSVPQADLARALELTWAAATALQAGAQALAEPNIATVYVLGVGMRTHTGVARKMFGALARAGINISMINTSEVRISVVVDRTRGALALDSLKDAFNLP